MREKEELFAFKSGAWLEKDKIVGLKEKLEEINFTTKICYEADQLSIQAELSEIALRMKLGQSQELIREQFEQLQKNYDMSFYANFDEYLKEYKQITKDKYRELSHDYLVKHPDKLEELQRLVKVPEIEQLDSNVGSLTQRMMNEQTEKREVVYIPSEDLKTQGVFIEVKE